MLELLAGLFGLLIGSFLNVCIYRWPRDLSVVRPRSHCISCDRQIAWFDNVPVLSYAMLRGRCRHCAEPIHWRYPLVEVLTALSFAWFVSQYGLSLEAAKYCVFAAMLIGLIFADLDMLILPDQFTIGGFFVGLAFSPFVKVPDSTFAILADIAGFHMGPRLASFAEAAFGGVFPAVVLWLLGWLFEKLRHKEGLGFGDVKMIGMIGAFLGIRGALFTVCVGSVLGVVIGWSWIKLTKQDASTYPLPLGTFLGIASLIAAVAIRDLPLR
jgi:leader peptidase (prepilin peptidase) / N-methyltransferase